MVFIQSKNLTLQKSALLDLLFAWRLFNLQTYVNKSFTSEIETFVRLSYK